MKSEQINIRLEPDLVAALERVAREEALDRGTAIRRLLEASIKDWEIVHALRGYQRGELSLGRAAEEAGLTQWELLDAARAAGIAYPLLPEDVERRLSRIDGTSRDPVQKLPHIPPKPGGVLLIGINPAPVSVAAGHYYQGRLGRRLWRRLERIGLLKDPVPGAEDEAFAGAGHGLTDLVKRPTTTSTELTGEEFASGVEALRRKIREWKPGLILFAFKEPARRLLGDVRAGSCPPFEEVPTFLLSGPYASKAEAQRIDGALRAQLGSVARGNENEADRTQPIQKSDWAAGRIRLPRSAARFFPAAAGEVHVVLRGSRIRAKYNPRAGTNKSATLSVGRDVLHSLAEPNATLRLERGVGGVILLE